MLLNNLALYKIVFVFEIYIAEMLFGASLKKKPFFWLRMLGGMTVNIVFALLLSLFIEGDLFSSTLVFPLVFAFSVFVLKFSFDRSWSTIIFIAFSAYTVQHFGYELSSFALSAIVWDRPPLYGMYDSSVFSFASFDISSFFYCWIYFFCVVGTDIAFYYIFARKIERRSDFQVKTDATLVLVGVGLFIDILFNSFVVAFGGDGVVTGLINNLYNCFCCALLLYALFTMLDSRRVREENKTIRALWRKAGEQYKLSKENIELINLKCHDLKHQIREIGGMATLSEQATREIEDSIGFYDSFVKTDNEALNVVLTEKSIRCHKNGITLSVIADGSSISFMNEVDVYSLFGNAFDNAIEACLDLPESERRVISLQIKQKNGMITVLISNSFSGSVRFGEDGMPLTKKKDDGYHGYGAKSIRSVIEKYDGAMNIRVMGNVFYLYALFPYQA